MANRGLAVIAACLALISCQSVAAGADPTDFIGYHSRDGWRVEVFETGEDKVTFGGEEILGPGRHHTEFSGPIESCADTEFYCYASVLRVAIPRAGTARSWIAHGIECQVLNASGLLLDRPVEIRCRQSEQYVVEFLFSRQRGIISYRRQCPRCFPDEYVLVGQRGLFATP
jgi:hypothetical protein